MVPRLVRDLAFLFLIPRDLQLGTVNDVQLRCYRVMGIRKAVLPVQGGFNRILQHRDDNIKASVTARIGLAECARDSATRRWANLAPVPKP